MLAWTMVVLSTAVLLWGLWERRGVLQRPSTLMLTISDASFVGLMLLVALENTTVLWPVIAGVSLVAFGIFGRIVAQREQAASARLDAEP
jgi:hypothetical protein